jgi:hypothetical protein
MDKEFVEECWFIYGLKIKRYFIGIKLYHSSGTPGGVRFDWSKCLSKFFIGWLHSHPSGVSHVSDTDDLTMNGWAIGLGRPLLCAVVCDGRTRVWQYWKKSKSRKNAAVCRQEIKIKFLKGPFILADTLVDHKDTKSAVCRV